jgi:hypothetical protein
MQMYVKRLDFFTACRRLDRYVADLAQAKGIEAHAIVGRDSPLFANGPDVYKIHLRNGSGETSLWVDHGRLRIPTTFSSRSSCHNWKTR